MLFRFINNSKFFLNKVQRDKQWFIMEDGHQVVKTAQEKINRFIEFNFEEAFNEDNSKRDESPISQVRDDLTLQ